MSITPNRVAAIATWLTGLGAFIAAIESTLPGKYADAILGAGGLLTSLATALHYMSGSQKFDAIQAAEDLSDVASPTATYDDEFDADIYRDSGVMPEGDAADSAAATDDAAVADPGPVSPDAPIAPAPGKAGS
jgi:hypothetical protein